MNLYRKNKKFLEKNHSYYPSLEHDACGVGLITSLDGKKRRDIVEYGIQSLKAVWHRGAVDADGKSGDGAGICVQHRAWRRNRTRRALRCLRKGAPPPRKRHKRHKRNNKRRRRWRRIPRFAPGSGPRRQGELLSPAPHRLVCVCAPILSGVYVCGYVYATQTGIPDTRNVQSFCYILAP